MKKIFPPFSAFLENKKIVLFLKKKFASQKIKKAVIGLSGGIDSALSLSLLSEALGPENIFVYHLYYFSPKKKMVKKIINQVNIPKKNISFISIKNLVKYLTKKLKIKDRIRKGNLMARVRMIILYDMAKKNKALVCGTENRSEYLLGYYTRFGDQASDIEPIAHLYKTQIYRLAKYLHIPSEIIAQLPSANLWEKQTDEKELGFSYQEADQILYLYFDKNISLKKIKKMGFENGKKIISFAKKNKFKKKVPYQIV